MKGDRVLRDGALAVGAAMLDLLPPREEAASVAARIYYLRPPTAQEGFIAGSQRDFLGDAEQRRTDGDNVSARRRVRTARLTQQVKGTMGNAAIE